MTEFLLILEFLVDLGIGGFVVELCGLVGRGEVW